jgi:hypothetical protein
MGRMGNTYGSLVDHQIDEIDRDMHTAAVNKVASGEGVAAAHVAFVDGVSDGGRKVGGGSVSWVRQGQLVGNARYQSVHLDLEAGVAVVTVN